MLFLLALLYLALRIAGTVAICSIVYNGHPRQWQRVVATTSVVIVGGGFVYWLLLIKVFRLPPPVFGESPWLSSIVYFILRFLFWIVALGALVTARGRIALPKVVAWALVGVAFGFLTDFLIPPMRDLLLPTLAAGGVFI